MRRIKIMAVFLLATCWLGACARPSPTASPLPTPSATSTLVPYPTSATGISVADIALTGPEEGWAVVNEWEKVSIRTLTRGVIYRLMNGRWSRVPDAPVTAGAYSCYKAIAATGPEDVWAAGMGYGVYGCQEGNVLVHHNHGRWEKSDIEYLFRRPGYNLIRTTGLWDLDMLDAEHGWVVGWHTILRYERGAWSIDLDVSAQDRFDNFMTISMAGSEEGWAGGEWGLYRYHDGAWRRWRDPLFDRAIVTTIEAVTPEDAWAAGYRRPTGEGSPVPLFWHFRRGRWEPVALPGEEVFVHDLKMLNTGEGWATGQRLTGDSRRGVPVSLRYVDGRWETIPVSCARELRAVDAVDAEHVWAGGDGFYRYTPDTGWERVAPAQVGRGE